MLNLLASAVPGLRDLRAPLVAGYLWLLVAWLALSPSTPLTDHAGSHVSSSLVDLAQTIGTLATGAALSVLAYVLGAISVSLPGVLASLLRPRLRRGMTIRGWADVDIPESAGGEHAVPLSTQMRSRRGSRAFRWMSRLSRGSPLVWGLTISVADSYWQELVDDLAALEDRVLDAEDSSKTESRKQDIRRKLWDVASSVLQGGQIQPPALEEVREALAERWRDLPPTHLGGVLKRASTLHDQIRRELDLPNTLLVGDQPEIYAEADRARAEAEFRLALVLPSLAMVAVLVAVGGWWWTLGLLAPLSLLAAGLAKKEEARIFIKNSIESGKTPSPSAHRFVEYVTRRLAA